MLGFLLQLQTFELKDQHGQEYEKGPLEKCDGKKVAFFSHSKLFHFLSNLFITRTDHKGGTF